MKKQNYIIILLTFLFLGGLIFWQVRNLQLNERLKTENENHEIQSILLATVIQIGKNESKDPSLRTSSGRLKNMTEDLMSQNFEKFERDFEWGYFNGNQEPIDSLNFDIKSDALANSTFKVCKSCLIDIAILNDDGQIDEDKGFMLNHTPAQIVSAMGLESAKLKYVHLLMEPEIFALSNYLIPIFFFIGLLIVMAWLLFFNIRQDKLIHQKNEFVNHLSHQFQTPLSSIKLSSNLLASNAAVNKDDLIQIIQTESTRLENHIKTVLNWVKSDADRLQIAPEKVMLTDIIEKSIKQMRPVFLTNKTKVVFIPPPDELFVFADRNHLPLMLFNIWENAIKHNDNPIELKIECVKSKDWISIICIDNGAGISQQNLDGKFKGLGLAYVKRIMEEHKGMLKLNASKTNGLTVILNFPYHD